MKVRPMRRRDRELPPQEAIRILYEESYGVLATVDGHGQPYAVPVNYVYDGSCLYIHSAREGHKIDNITHNPHVSFCVVSKAELVPDKVTTRYRSVIAFGEANLVDGEEKEKALLQLLEKCGASKHVNPSEYVKQWSEATAVIRVRVAHVSGKSNEA
ncbi:pyridoxamine 5'-phosphate oxidase family protein [Coprothermobacteraceae bacterium]|nr:pyridoxamine 5'-phosphate oxidase family protein [Coprothermobacteraceae bacterium]